MTADPRIEQIRAVLDLSASQLVEHWDNYTELYEWADNERTRRIRAILDSTPTDSETEWGRRWTGTGVVQEFGDRREDAEDACYPNTQLVRREVGPWTEVQP